MTDIKMSEDWHLTQATDGDAPVTSGTDELLQRIRMEAMTQEGELFYDETWGWNLAEFLQAEDSDFTRLEIEQRIKSKLRKYEEINSRTVEVDFVPQATGLLVEVRFTLATGEDATIEIQLDRVSVEVISVD